MTVFSMLGLILLLLSLEIQPSLSSTVVVDGVSEWKDPNVQIGDSVIFQHKYHYNLYIFQNQNAFNVCNFSQATLLTRNSSSYTWHPSRPGFFFFSFNNGTDKACLQGQKLAVKVSLLSPPPESQPPQSPGGVPSLELPPRASPPVISGGIVSSSPAYPWPFQPREEASSPSPAPSVLFPANGPMVPAKGSEIPFINSNPAVPLPTGEVDSATIRPLPTSAAYRKAIQVVGFSAVPRALCCILLILSF